MTAYAMWNQMVGQEIDGVELDGKVYSVDTIRAALLPWPDPVPSVGTDEPCPACGAGRLRTANGGGVVCNAGCGYWFCY